MLDSSGNVSLGCLVNGTVNGPVNASLNNSVNGSLNNPVSGSAHVPVNASVNGLANGSTRWLVSARYTFFTVNLPDSEAQVAAMGVFRTSAAGAAPGLGGLAYGDDFFAFEGYAVIWRETVLALAIASGVVFVLMLLLLADLGASLLVGASVALVNVELLGFIHWFGLTFNLVTSLTLLLGLGIAVDYSAFIAYSFLTQRGTGRERAAKALDHLGEAAFNGGLTMFLAVVLVSFARSYVFQTFFKMFSMIVLLGLWHGLVALPVALALVGSRPFSYSVAQEPSKPKTHASGSAIVDESMYSGTG